MNEDTTLCDTCNEQDPPVKTVAPHKCLACGDDYCDRHQRPVIVNLSFLKRSDVGLWDKFYVCPKCSEIMSFFGEKPEQDRLNLKALMEKVIPDVKVRLTEVIQDVRSKRIGNKSNSKEKVKA